jgi:hypothetical protein
MLFHLRVILLKLAAKKKEGENRRNRGFQYIDIRIFYPLDDGFRPSKKGITLNKDQFPELLRGIFSLAEALGIDEESLAVILSS